ncbi:MAG: hypothetical protein ACE5DL_01020 [Nitrosopumilaceae archaeon]
MISSGGSSGGSKGATVTIPRKIGIDTRKIIGITMIFLIIRTVI